MSLIATGLTISGELHGHPSDVSAQYLVVGAGGGGGINGQGGGGAGAVLTGTTALIIGFPYVITIGQPNGYNNAGGGDIWGGDGDPSSLIGSKVSLTAFGGTGNIHSTYTGGTSGNGNVGGTGAGAVGGGGAGAGAVGGNAGAVPTYSGAGGDGISSSITGTPTYYGGGGAGAHYGNDYLSGLVGNPGLGGGGGAGAGGGGGGAGTPNTGGGGGAGSFSGNLTMGGNGGSGVVVIRIPTAFYTGNITGSPVVTTVGSDTVIQFNASGTYTA
jgi:hypothetical protein